MAKKFRKMTKKAVRDVAALKEEVADLKKDMAQLQAKIGDLHERLQTELGQAKQTSKRGEKEAKGKVRPLEEKAEKAKGEARAAVKRRMTNV